ncbi:hypothetical protein CEUSTIGMA_g8553.t1 [Chlamydomonas eustigma]|uniref:RRM domain-containing protein n=1 Tax=Chlamydomonas eustigma TaxID=1157962 RepID=A0A250XDY3_9CHLO|nr:hypothetical protein CEUSTIGMA_g8553.t1 [Chlamydomonas eustigma]|eukprot:GAX81119.1 hypothetical protein CEUSTIGMA_g8553.t1 [Chlamydomonas eustigma]
MEDAQDGQTGFDSEVLLRKFYARRAYEEENALSSPTPQSSTLSAFCAPAKKLGVSYGMGIGLYMWLLTWLSLLFLFMAVAAVPFMVTVSLSVFTDYAHQKSPEYGVKVYPSTEISSFTFAAIVSPVLDNNTLMYMNTEVANTWLGPMLKATFLKWVSYVDAGASLLVLIAIALIMMRSHHFVESMDRKCLEVSDYTVVVQGLPGDVKPLQVAEYFARYGDIVETQLVVDNLSQVLEKCARVSHLEQQCELLEDLSRVRHPKPGLLNRVSEASDKVQVSLQEALAEPSDASSADPVVTAENSERRRAGVVKLAFVTFNSMSAVHHCLACNSQGWLSSLCCMWRSDLFEGKHHFWVKRAGPPEDYLYENLGISRGARWARKALTRVVVFLMLVSTAAIVTALSSVSFMQVNSIDWLSGSIYEDAQSVMPSSSLNGSSGDLLEVQLHCQAALNTSCSAYYGSQYGNSLDIQYGGLLDWSNLSQGLLDLRPLIKKMQAGTVPDQFKPCYPCFCLGLMTNVQTGNEDWQASATSSCSTYVNKYRLGSWGVRISVSLAIALLNSALKLVLEFLLMFEGHVSRSGLERTYAFVAYAALFLNSVVVLLLVNASPIRSATHTPQTSSSPLTKLIFNGDFDDFTQGWYEDVGLSLLILVAINAISPVTTLWFDQGYKLCMQLFLRLASSWDVSWGTRDQYSASYSRPEFNLQQRVADILLNVTIAFIFGSGIPLIYVAALLGLLLQICVDRYAIVKACTVACRYSQLLPHLIIDVLPWSLLLHCCFGLWMNTYFPVIDTSGMQEELLTKRQADDSAASTLLTPMATSSYGQRIVQANGIAFLFVAALVVVWLLWSLFFHHVLGATLHRACCCLYNTYCCYSGQSRENNDEQRTSSAVMDGRDHSAENQHSALRALRDTMTFEQALMIGVLHGTPTYRVHHHPKYYTRFLGCPQARAIWVTSTGGHSFTRLASEGGVLHQNGGTSFMDMQQPNVTMTASNPMIVPPHSITINATPPRTLRHTTINRFFLAPPEVCADMEAAASAEANRLISSAATRRAELLSERSKESLQQKGPNSEPAPSLMLPLSQRILQLDAAEQQQHLTAAGPPTGMNSWALPESSVALATPPSLTGSSQSMAHSRLVSTSDASFLPGPPMTTHHVHGMLGMTHHENEAQQAGQGISAFEGVPAMITATASAPPLPNRAVVRAHHTAARVYVVAVGAEEALDDIELT